MLLSLLDITVDFKIAKIFIKKNIHVQQQHTACFALSWEKSKKLISIAAAKLRFTIY